MILIEKYKPETHSNLNGSKAHDYRGASNAPSPRQAAVSFFLGISKPLLLPQAILLVLYGFLQNAPGKIFMRWALHLRVFAFAVPSI